MSQLVPCSLACLSDIALRSSHRSYILMQGVFHFRVTLHVPCSLYSPEFHKPLCRECLGIPLCSGERVSLHFQAGGHRYSSPRTYRDSKRYFRKSLLEISSVQPPLSPGPGRTTLPVLQPFPLSCPFLSLAFAHEGPWSSAPGSAHRPSAEGSPSPTLLLAIRAAQPPSPLGLVSFPFR